MYELKKKEMIFVFTGPHGTGRKTVADMSGSTLGMKQVLSYTTRPKRPSEEGQEYHFVTREQFEEAQHHDQFIEVNEIDGHLFGIKSSELATLMYTHSAVYLILNRFGAETLKQLYGDKVTRIFIYADPETVKERLWESSESEQDIERYMSHYDEEMAYRDHCEHIFENLDLAHTVFDLTKTLDSYLTRNLIDMD